MLNMNDKKLKTCKFCKNNTLDVEYLGTNPDDGNKLFSVVCYNGCTDYIYSFNPKTKFYMRTRNLNKKVQ